MAVTMSVSETTPVKGPRTTVTGYPVPAGEEFLVETTYEGCVLDTYEVNGYDDSDFFAIVWDEAAGKPTQVCFATTRGWTYLNGATVDATPEVLEKAEAWLREYLVGRLADADARDAETPKQGRLVRVENPRGRSAKYPHGTEGFMGATFANRFRRGGEVCHLYDAPAGGARVAEFVPLEKLAVVEPEQYRLSAEEVEERAATLAKGRNLRGVFYRGVMF